MIQLIRPSMTPHHSDRHVRVARVAAVVAGIGASTQTLLNGRLATSIGSPVLAGSINMVVGFAALAAVAIVTGAPGRARRRLAQTPNPRWWTILVGITGATAILVTTAGASRVGVALLTVALVSGQSVGGLAVDRSGISPGGRRAITGGRIAGIVLTLVAVVIGAIGTTGPLPIGLLTLIFVAGVGMALQQAALGYIAGTTGEPVLAGGVNYGVGGLILIAAALAVTGGSAPAGWSAPPIQWVGGLIGGMIIVTVSSIVRTLGVLQLMLAFVAGQSVGALVLDLVVGIPGRAVTAATFISVALMFIAVLVGATPRQLQPELSGARLAATGTSAKAARSKGS
jgi:bacterial/archaeal transporter family-2 protein